jgi:asparagine synthase (glutamine-hydrolysing)
MCGIVGYSGDFPSEVLSVALEQISHRGPDDAGVFFKHKCQIGLGHTRLSILDLSQHGHQPMLSDDGDVTLVFNGEIYNFRELREELEAIGHQFRGNSDTEVLLRLYMVEGESVLRRLNGIFAFALWDSRSQALLVARDGLGVKPLYYTATAEQFAFASEIKALASLMHLDGELDFQAIDRYLTFMWCPGEGTPAKSVRKLGPGEAMWVRAGKIERHFKWYQLPVFRKTTTKLNTEKYVEMTAQNLRQAVHRQMVADVPVGAFLSGGIDSSSIVAFASELAPNIRCFTIEATGGAEAGSADDLPYARRVAQYLKVPLEVVHINAGCVAEDLEGMISKLDEPLSDPASLNVLYISRLAREHGIKVMLSGAGGDDLFTGYRRHQALMLDDYWIWLPRPFRAGLEKITAAIDQRGTLGRRISKLFHGAALDGDARLVNYFVWSKREDLAALYTEDFKAALGKSEAFAPMLDFLKELPPTLTKIDRILSLEQRFFLADHNLIYTDKMSMAAGVEVRVPFLDLDLVEFAQEIPARLKQRGSVGKWVLKKAMEPYLPKDVIYRPKSGFGAPLRRWMRFELKELLNDLLSESSLRNRGLFNPVAVHRLIAANDSGKLDASYTLFSLLCVELWCRRFIDQPIAVK